MIDLSALPRMLSAQDWPAAERLLRRAAKAKGAPAAVFYNLAKVLEAQGKLAQRETWLRRALALDPRHAAAWFELGRVLLDDACLREAEGAFAHALRLDPADREARGLLLRLRLRLCDWQGATEALDGLPDTPQTRAARYRIAAETGQPTEGLRAALLSDAQARPEALKAMTRVARGSLPLRLPNLS